MTFQQKTSEFHKKVSVIIPCRNEEKYIGRCLESLLGSDYPLELLEILIIDGRSSDKTPEIIEKFSREYDFIRMLDNPRLITPVALNIGIKNANYEYVMITSAHSSFPKEYIRILIEKLKKMQSALSPFPKNLQ